MNLFFFDKLDIEKELIALDEEESRHAVRTLRLKNGDTINATDGYGTLYTCEIIDNHQKKCLLKVVGKEYNYKKRNFRVHIASSLTKNIARIEYFIEKAIEIGLDEFTPIVFKHSERVSYNADRLRKIAISAVKQSNNLYLPIINPLLPFDSFLQQLIASKAQKFIAYQSENEQHLKFKVVPYQEVIILIGPEGDFTTDEIEKARINGFEIVNLGNYRLRTETAALLACSIVNISNV